MSTNQPRTSKNQSAADALTYNVAGLLGEPVGSIRDVVVDSPPLDLGPDLRQLTGVTGTLRLTRTNRGLLIHGKLATSIEQQCSRCLTGLDYPVEVELDDEALPTIDLATGIALDDADEPDALRLSDHHELELEPAVRDAIVVAEPIAPLCRPDCPGLCLICGLELAGGQHDHAGADIDPRLEALRGLLADDGD